MSTEELHPTSPLKGLKPWMNARERATVRAFECVAMADSCMAGGRMCKALEDRTEMREVALAYAAISKAWFDVANLLVAAPVRDMENDD